MCAITRSGPATDRAVSMSDSRSPSSKAGNSPVVPVTNRPSTTPATKPNSRRAPARSSEPSAANGVGTADRTTSPTSGLLTGNSAGLFLVERGRVRAPQQVYDGHADQPDREHEDDVHDPVAAPRDQRDGPVGRVRPQREQHRGGVPRPALPGLVQPGYQHPYRGDEDRDQDREEDGGRYP